MSCSDWIPKKTNIECGQEPTSNEYKNTKKDWAMFRIACPQAYELAKRSFEDYKKLFKEQFQKGTLQ